MLIGLVSVMKNLEKYNIPSFDCPIDYSRLHKEELSHVSDSYDNAHLKPTLKNIHSYTFRNRRYITDGPPLPDKN